MSDRAFFDTNVLVYVVGQKDDRTVIDGRLTIRNPFTT
jgi:predicted nucleic acid-binding protein